VTGADTWIVRSPDEMIALGRRFGESCRGREVFLLDGPLGSGKTQWVKGLGSGLGITQVINSPAFTLVKEYVGRLTLHHVDLYRLHSGHECVELGLEDLVSPRSVLAIEWAGRYPEFRGGREVQLQFEMGARDDERRVTRMCRDSSPDRAPLRSP
jgi:tRNA threonylcarbamoyladenosine biosynthesis protein TsaE